MYDPGRNFGFLLHDVARLLRKRFDQRARSVGMTRAQWAVLAYVERNEGLRQRELADLLEVEPITVGRLVDKLAAAGLLERRADPGDRRAHRLHLLPAAHPALEQMKTVGSEIRIDTLRGLSRPEIDAIQRGLEIMKGNLSG
jgi:MarR family transcriptional regulator for hemolysin